jgi:hypothetical protein
MEFRVLDKTGDTKVIFDKNSEEEVEIARESFSSLLKKGFNAFLVKKDGTPGKSVKTFNPEAEMYIFIPPMVGG